VGVGIGVSAVVVPTYVAEMAPANHRGALVSLYEALLCVGMLCASLINFALHDAPGASLTRKRGGGGERREGVFFSLWVLPDAASKRLTLWELNSSSA
jgi:MFS family permease